MRSVKLRLQHTKPRGSPQCSHELQPAEISAHWRGNDRRLDAYAHLNAVHSEIREFPMVHAERSFTFTRAIKAHDEIR